MDKTTTGRGSFNWRLPLYGAGGALILFVPVIIAGTRILELPYFFVAAPLISLALLVVAIRKHGRQRIAVLAMLIAYGVTSFGLFKNSYELRMTSRWLLWSKDYKAKLLAQHNLANGALRHIEWDGWGFPGAGNTTLYLIFDPKDSLSTAARTHSSAKFSGLPCEVSDVRRLESHYYSVLFYTDADWDHCK